MKCIKCKSINISSANYCKSCGYKFSEEEKEKAKNKSIIGIIEKIEKAYNVCTLKVITDSIVFKSFTLLIVIVLGIFSLVNNGSKVKILESKDYRIQYNTKENEYYLLTSKDKTTLDLYVPNKVQDISIKNLDTNNNELSSISYKDNENVVLNTNGIDDYYILESYYEKGREEKVKIYIYRTED